MRFIIGLLSFCLVIVAAQQANAIIICDQQGCRSDSSGGHAGATNPSAIAVRSFVGNDVFKAVQCDVGKLAAHMNREKIVVPSDKRFVKFTYKGTDVTEYKGGVSFGLRNLLSWISAPAVAAEGSNKRTLKDQGSATINLHPDNARACAPNNGIPVRVYECLSSKTLFIQSDGAACSTEVTAYGKFNASGKVTIWFFSIGPSAEYNATKTFYIEASAPPQPTPKQ